MTYLMLGVGMWFLIHISPSVFSGRRLRLLDFVGQRTYRGIFSILLLASLALIIIGWRESMPITIYEPPNWGRHLNWLLMIAALILFVSGFHQTNLKRYIRHPMLLGVAVWSFGHLLANGDVRSMVLFGGIGAWSLLSIITINRRDGEWSKPQPVSRIKDIITLSIGIIMYVALVFSHTYIAGVQIAGNG